MDQDNFDCLHSYIQRVAEGKRRKVGQHAESLAWIPPTPSAPGPSATTGYITDGDSPVLSSRVSSGGSSVMTTPSVHTSTSPPIVVDALLKQASSLENIMRGARHENQRSTSGRQTCSGEHGLPCSNTDG